MANTGIEYQLNKGPAPNINVPLYPKPAHQRIHRDKPARHPNSLILQFLIMWMSEDIL